MVLLFAYTTIATKLIVFHFDNISFILMFIQPYKALGMLNFIEKTQFSKSSSPDRDEWTAGRESKDPTSDTDTSRASISQVMCSVTCT